MVLKQFLLVLSVVAWSQTYAFQTAPFFEDRQFGFAAHSEYYNTDGNLRPDGSYVGLGEEMSFQTFSVRLAADYRIKPNWRLTGGGEVIYAKSTDTLVDRTTTELNYLFIESLHTITYRNFILAPQMRFVGTLKEIDHQTDDVIAGEGTHQFEFGGWLATQWGPLEPFLYVGYRLQNDGRANLLPYQVGARYSYDDLYLLGEVYGYFPVSEDEYSDLRNLREQVTFRVNGNSWRYYAVDPTLIEGRGEIGYRITPDLVLYGGGAHTISGKSVAYGYTLNFGMLYTFSGKKTKSRPGFEPIMDEYDESLFTPTNE